MGFIAMIHKPKLLKNVLKHVKDVKRKVKQIIINVHHVMKIIL